jgi:hypothetical protein
MLHETQLGMVQLTQIPMLLAKESWNPGAHIPQELLFLQLMQPAMLGRDLSQMMHSEPVGDGTYMLLSTTQAKQKPVLVQLAQLGTLQLVGAGGGGRGFVVVSLIHLPIGSTI